MAEPDCLDRPAIARHGVSTPHTLRLFKKLNAAKPFGEQIKPYNFLNIAFVHPIERPADERRIVLIAPYQPDPRRWMSDEWLNRYSGRPYRITTEPSDGSVKPGTVTVKTYRDIIDEFATHPEAKSASHDGRPCPRHGRVSAPTAGSPPEHDAHWQGEQPPGGCTGGAGSGFWGSREPVRRCPLRALPASCVAETQEAGRAGDCPTNGPQPRCC
jgi:hypothetical protein